MVMVIQVCKDTGPGPCKDMVCLPLVRVPVLLHQQWEAFKDQASPLTTPSCQTFLLPHLLQDLTSAKENAIGLTLLVNVIENVRGRGDPCMLLTATCKFSPLQDLLQDTEDPGTPARLWNEVSRVR